MTDDLRPLLEAIVSNVDEAITVLDASGRFVFVNDGAAGVLGFQSASEVLTLDGKALRERYHMVDEHREPIPIQELPSSRAWSGEAAPEMLVGWRTGEMAELRWSMLRSVPLKTADGRVRLVINFFKDVTEKRRRDAEERLLTEVSVLLGESLDIDVTLQKLAQRVVPELGDWGVVELADEPGSLSRPRRVATAHVDPQKLEVAREMARRWPMRWDPNAPGGVAAVIRTGQPQLVPTLRREALAAYSQDAEHLKMLERIGMHSVLLVPLRTPGRGVTGVLSLISTDGRRTYAPRDLELALELGRRAGAAIENARLYAAVEHANQQKDEFLAMLGHELRNPLAPMANAIRVMQAQPASAERARDVIERQLAHLTRLVDDLLDVSRISRGMIPLQRERLDLSALLDDVGEDHLDVFLEQGLELRLECAPGVFVFGDRVRLQQVAGNLLGNALKYTPHGGKVKLSLSSEGGRARLTVTDDGEGIAPQMLPRLFQPFTQGQRGLDRKAGGLGLGLAVVRGIVELHGGEVAARSPGVGKGASFEVSLPLAPADAPRPPAPSAPRPKREPRSMTVLVIDDNVDLALTMRDLLAFEAKSVEVEHSGKNALDAIRRLKPDVVICDIGLPEKDGYTIAREVRADPSLGTVRLVALSGYGMEQDKQRALDSGFALHLVKPVPPDDLLRVLDEA